MMKKLWLLVLLLVMQAGQVVLAERTKQIAKLEDAIEVLQDFSRIPETSIPTDLLRGAEGIAVVPGVIKAGFVVGGKLGKGLLSVRSDDGTWSYPTFVTIAGGSVGFQAGVQSTDLVLVFKSRKSIEGIVRGKFTIGADASAAAGPVGRTAEARTDANLDAEIYAYSRSRGLFAGISLDGAVIDIDHDANGAIYGQDATPRRIFGGKYRSPSPVLVDFRDMLEEQTAQ